MTPRREKSSLAVVDMVLDFWKTGRRWNVLEEEVEEVVPTREIVGSPETLSSLFGREFDFLMRVSLDDKSRGLMGLL